MSQDHVVASVRESSQNRSEIDIQGTVTGFDETSLVEAYNQAVRGNPAAIVFNLRGLDDITSAGIGIFFKLLADARRRNIQLQAGGVNERNRRIFELTGLSEFIDLQPAEAGTISASPPAADKTGSSLLQPATTGHGGVWAAPVSRLDVPLLPAEGSPGKERVINLNVNGRRPSGPLSGFGRFWQKTYRISLADARVTPRQVVQTWKAEFSTFWPQGNRFFGSAGPIAPGQVAILYLAGPGGHNFPGGLPFIVTGVLVIYADDESFSFYSTAGHILSGMITFSAYKNEKDITVVQVQVIGSASDPLYELTFRLGLGDKMEDGFWKKSLENVAARFGAKVSAEQTTTILDPRVQWSRFGNIWQNAATRTMLYAVLSPFRWLGQQLKK